MYMCTQNCSGAYNKTGSIRSSIESGNLDILVLTETHMKEKHLNKFNAEIGYNCKAGKEKIIHDVSNTGDYKGVTVIIKKNLPLTIIEISKSGIGHHIVIKAKLIRAFKKEEKKIKLVVKKHNCSNSILMLYNGTIDLILSYFLKA